jgi:hypothetical protein
MYLCCALSERLIWSGLLVALLLVTPVQRPARPGAPSDSSGDSNGALFGEYTGIVAVDANAGGKLVVEVLELTDAKWGNDVSL